MNTLEVKQLEEAQDALVFLDILPEHKCLEFVEERLELIRNKQMEMYGCTTIQRD